MSAVFAELDIDSMTVTDAALRDGVFYDLIGRQLNEDMREQTIANFQQRYHVSPNQAQRVASLAAQFFEMLAEREPEKERHYWQQYLRWAALVHEIGTDIAYTAYHKHSAYILGQADMPGFSHACDNDASRAVKHTLNRAAELLIHILHQFPHRRCFHRQRLPRLFSYHISSHSLLSFSYTYNFTKNLHSIIHPEMHYV